MSFWQCSSRQVSHIVVSSDVPPSSSLPLFSLHRLFTGLFIDSGTKRARPKQRGCAWTWTPQFPYSFPVCAVCLSLSLSLPNHYFFDSPLVWLFQLFAHGTPTSERALIHPNPTQRSYFFFGLCIDHLPTLHSPLSLILFTFSSFSSLPFCLHPSFAISFTSHSSTLNPNTPSCSVSLSLCLSHQPHTSSLLPTFIRPPFPHF